MTWFRGNPDIRWIEKDPLQEILDQYRNETVSG
jgi:hypothetical protein